MFSKNKRALAQSQPAATSVPVQTIKVVMIGDSMVGKSQLINRYRNNQYADDSEMTLGVNLACRKIQIDNNEVRVQIFDTPGQERLRSISKPCYKDADAFILVFDLTNLDSFMHLGDWVQEVRTLNVDARIILVGAKSDLNEKRVISAEQVDEFMRHSTHHLCGYFERSSKDGNKNGNNITDIFVAAASSQMNNLSEESGVVLSRTM